VPYDALRRQLADVESLLQQHKREMAELKAMVATLVERQAAPNAPNVETTPTRRRVWWRRLLQ
jgi:hypothetical protein